ncbi:hypothetical protein X729_32480 [Mesorhizobium sp. L103C131B0]|nr:hypothetical protein X729_32480 [Mesorhizobium sp. L103C131B0]
MLPLDGAQELVGASALRVAEQLLRRALLLDPAAEEEADTTAMSLAKTILCATISMVNL